MTPPTDTAVTSSSVASLRPALEQIDLRLRLAVDAFREESDERARDPYRGLYITAEDVELLLGSTPAGDAARERLRTGPLAPVAPRLARLAELFRLTAFEQDALLVCLAPEVDLRYERIFSYLQDDVTRRRPTADLVLRLLADDAADWGAHRAALGPSGTLLREGLLSLVDEPSTQGSQLARALRPDERVVDYLLGFQHVDPRISAYAELYAPGEQRLDWALQSDTGAAMVRLLERRDEESVGPVVLYVHGAADAPKRAASRAACQANGWPLLVADLEAVMNTARPEQAMTLVAREALLQEAVLALEGMEPIFDAEGENLAAQQALRSEVERRTLPTILLGRRQWEPATWFGRATAIRAELKAPTLGVRTQAWRDALNGVLPADDAPALAARFRLDGDDIQAVAAAARGRAAWRGEELLPADILAAARGVAAPPMEGLARRVETRYTWDDIILHADGLALLREVSGRMQHKETVLDRWGFGRKLARRAGATALFVGQPGTGKTMAAEILAGELGLDLYRVDLASVVSKYIGETEKNLERIFQAAERGDGVMLFDEADALFGKRSETRDAHDRYANVEIAYLLQRLEVYDGLAILTTNLRGNLDEAFLRRLDFVLEFPIPEEPERLLILQRSLPPDAPLADDVDLGFLAKKFKLSGGHLRNIALGGAYLAAADGGPIAMKHLVRAVRREYQKLGKLVAESDFEHYYALLKE